MKKGSLSTILLIILISGLMIVATARFNMANAETSVIGIITSDAIWTKANSPYSVKGPVAVNTGVTLTIEAGTTVNLGVYYMQVNGTLQALGSPNNKVQFNGGKIIFTEVSNGWNEQSDTGCKIENAIFNETTVSSNVALKIINSQTTGDITVIDYSKKSLFSNNYIDGRLDTRNAYILDNQISYGLKAVDSNLVGCTVFGGLTGGFLSITQCIVQYYSTYSGQSAISLTGEVTITNCTVRGGGSIMDFAGRYVDEIEAIIISGSPVKISNNIIYGGLKIENKGNQNSEVSSNVFSGHLSVHGGQALIFGNHAEGTDGSISASGSTVIIQNNTVQGISFGGYSIVVCDNTVFKSYNGINAHTDGSAIIERNLIYNNTQGIRCNSPGITIRNNTIKDNQVGIYLDNSGPTISYNNIENNKDSIYQTRSDNVEAANNYWGTTDKVKIDNSIHDFYDDFNLGKVNYSPVLTEVNLQAMPDPNTPVPETVSNPTSQDQTLLLLIPLTVVVAAVILAVDALTSRNSKTLHKQ